MLLLLSNIKAMHNTCNIKAMHNICNIKAMRNIKDTGNVFPNSNPHLCAGSGAAGPAACSG